MIIDTVQRLFPSQPIDAVDFVCAASFMLSAFQHHLPNFRSGLGLDVFRAGMPAADKGMAFGYVGLFKQLHRIQGGIAILLDPRPFIVRAGALVGRFNSGYIPSLWSRNSLLEWLGKGQLAGKFSLESFEVYWRSSVLSLGWMEQLLPTHCSLHQCAVLRATGSDAKPGEYFAAGSQRAAAI